MALGPGTLRVQCAARPGSWKAGREEWVAEVMMELGQIVAMRWHAGYQHSTAPLSRQGPRRSLAQRCRPANTLKGLALPAARP